jgi:iron-sulfur cluster assembly protein
MVTITSRAADKIKESAKQTDAQEMALRIAVTDNPDGSFHYAFGFDENGVETDVNVETQGLMLVYAADQASKLDQMVIDFVELEAGKESFIFLNPSDPTYVPPSED